MKIWHRIFFEDTFWHSYKVKSVSDLYSDGGLSPYL
jgi:hypothetical protein